MRRATTRFDPFGPWLVRAVLAGAVSACLTSAEAAPQATQPANAVWDFNIPAGELEVSLDRFATRTGLQLAYRPEVVAGKRNAALSGRMTWRDALGRLLQGSGLEFRQVNDAAIVIERTEPAPKRGNRPATAASPAASGNGEAKVTDIEKVTVTGTRIRGGTTPSPVITIGSERIQQEGFTDLGEVIRSIPQNFTGGQNPGVLMGNVTGGGMANQNVTGGSGLNLRGLGPDASLTLLNGRRMAYGGFSQAVDISAIPVEAVDRVEIVADGASAIYGSDAVGGVANVILKREFDGVALGARYGVATDGGLGTREYNATAGTAWRTGGFLATYQRTDIDPIYARQRSYTAHLPEPQTIYPGMDTRSVLLSAYQSVGDAAELRLDALRTQRDQTYNYYFYSTTIYNRLASETTTSFAAPSLTVFLPGDWSATLGGAWGKDERFLDHSRVNVASGTATPYLSNCHCNRSRTIELGAEGRLFAAPGGEARLALGVGRRKNEYVYPNYLTGRVSIRGEEASRFTYAELNVPLIGEESRIHGAQRLALTAAVRKEDYDRFGGVSTPKLGVIYDPNSSLTVKASWGRSFKAPTLFQRYWGQTASLDLASYYGAEGVPEDATALYIGGGNPDLEPERARTWSATLALHPERLPGFEAELTWFDIDYTDRVLQPITTDVGLLTSPIFAEFVTLSPTAERVNAVLAPISDFYNYTDAPYDPSRVVAIIDGRYVNALRQRIKGIDLSSSYGVDVGPGRLTLRGAASWLDSTQRTSGMPAGYALAGTLHNAAKVHGRAGAVWVQSGFTGSLFANYTSGVRDMTNGRQGASFTTFDATLRYDVDHPQSVFSGWQFALSVNNLLDRKPPLYAPVAPDYVAPYDSTNYSAIGRFLSASVSKRW